MEPDTSTEVEANGKYEGEATVKIENAEDGSTSVFSEVKTSENLLTRNEENTEVKDQIIEETPVDDVDNKEISEGKGKYTDITEGDTERTNEEKVGHVDNAQADSTENFKVKTESDENKDEKMEKDAKMEEVTDKTTCKLNEKEATPESSEFIEFEFTPIKAESSVGRERSSSPDAGAVVDQLYEAARMGDSGKLCNLMFSDLQSKNTGTKNAKISGSNGEGDKGVGNHAIGIHGVNQNKAIINLLKRKTPIEKEHIVSDFETSKKQKLESGKIIDFTNVKNIRSLGTLPIGNLVGAIPKEKPPKTYVKRKNPFRTPTPPNLSPTPHSVYKYTPRVTVQNVLNATESSSAFTKQQKAPPVNQNVERNLIDYSVLTKALTKTLESKLQEGEDNDVKIVIFCNNKPIQSFSVRSNAKQEAPAPSISNLPPSVLPPASASLSDETTQKILKMDVGNITNGNDILAQNPVFLSKQINQDPGLTSNRIPTIADVKAILERNRRIANESLAKFSSNRTKTKRIPDEHLAVLLKEFQTNGVSETDSGLQVGELPKIDSNSNGNDNKSEEELEDRNLVINDSVTTDENCNESVGEIQCDQCQKVFKQRRYLNRHKIRVHSSSKAKVHPEQVLSEQEQAREDLINQTIKQLLATPGEKTLENENNVPTIGNENNVPSKDTNGTVEGEKLDGTVEELDTAIVKTEPVSDSEDQEIQSLLADDNVLNLLETADKNKRSLYSQENPQHGLLAKDLLGQNLKTKAPFTDFKSKSLEEGITEPVYVCEQCGKFYRARKTLKDHFLREHAKDKDDEPLYLYITGNKYQCPICFNNYHSGSELVSHTKKHTGELRSVCKLCGKVYSSVHVLRRHIDNIHSDFKPRPFQCELCDYAASNKWHLKEHYRRHTGEQPYKCPVCVKSFSHQGTMNRHCKTIHKIELPSQRPFVRNNIMDLPDLPMDTYVGEAELQEKEESVSPMNEDLNLTCSETELPDNSSGSEKDLDLDLSIVKTEPQEVDVV